MSASNTHAAVNHLSKSDLDNPAARPTAAPQQMAQQHRPTQPIKMPQAGSHPYNPRMMPPTFQGQQQAFTNHMQNLQVWTHKLGLPAPVYNRSPIILPHQVIVTS